MIEPLPALSFITKDQQWDVIGTADTEDGVMDTLRNTVTGEIKTIERMKFIRYLEKISAQPIQPNKKSVNLSSVNNQLNFKL